jgi:hypothetical protein
VSTGQNWAIADFRPDHLRQRSRQRIPRAAVARAAGPDNHVEKTLVTTQDTALDEMLLRTTSS